MNPAQFEATYSPQWDELETLLAAQTGKRRSWRAKDQAPPDAARLAALYRAVCEHLALAQGRAYPIQLAERLEDLAHQAHQLIYRQHDLGWHSLVRLFLVDVPAAFREQRRYIWLAAVLFYGPFLAMTLATWLEPGHVLTVMEPSQASMYEKMYDTAGKIGRQRSADTDWYMFGFYIRHNIGIGFQCFAGGMLAGVGSVFYLVFNGLQMGAVAGFLTARGHGGTFWPFVSGHAPFELTAIVISGAAGLLLGHALLAPGRLRRSQALARAGQASVPLICAVIVMLVIAAAIEAFWSSSQWVSPPFKYVFSASGWLLVAAYMRLRVRTTGTSHVG